MTELGSCHLVPAAGAHSHRAEAITKVQAASSRPAPVKSPEELKREREEQQRELKALAERSAAAAARRKEEEAEHAEANKAAILAKYAGSSDGWEETLSDVPEAEVEDWELWGDPREVRMRKIPSHMRSTVQHLRHTLRNQSEHTHALVAGQRYMHTCVHRSIDHTDNNHSGDQGGRGSASTHVCSGFAGTLMHAWLQIERRRAERARAAQLNMLSAEERQLQLAQELKQATDSAKQAKAEGNKQRKQVAGEVIRHIKLEIAALGIKEAAIHALIAQHFPSAAAAPPAAAKAAGGAGGEAWPALGAAAGGGGMRSGGGDSVGCESEYVLAEARPSFEQQVAASAPRQQERRSVDAWDHEYVLVDSDGSERAVLAASLRASGVSSQAAVAAPVRPCEGGGVAAEVVAPAAAVAAGATGDEASSAAAGTEKGGKEEGEFDANLLWCGLWFVVPRRVAAMKLTVDSGCCIGASL